MMASLDVTSRAEAVGEPTRSPTVEAVESGGIGMTSLTESAAATERTRRGVSLALSRSTVTAGSRLKARIGSPSRQRRPALLQVRAQARWKTVASGKISRRGKLTLRLIAPPRTAIYRAVLPRHKSRAGRVAKKVVSAPVKLRVSPKPPPVAPPAGHPQPASLRVVLVDAPSGAAVTVTSPHGQVRTIDRTTVFPDAAVGAWEVAADPVAQGAQTIHAVDPTQRATVRAGQARTLTIDYGVSIPDSTAVLDPSEIAGVETLPGGVIQIRFTEAAASAARAVVAERLRNARSLLALGPHDRRTNVEMETPQRLARARAHAASTVSNCSGSIFVLCEGDVGAVGITSHLPHGGFGRVPAGGAGPDWVRLDPTGVSISDALTTASAPASARALTVAKTVENRRLTKNISCSAGLSGELAATFTINPTLDFGMVIADHGLQEAHVVARVDQSADISATVTGSGECAFAPQTLLHRPLPAITVTIGGVFPLVLVPELNVLVGADVKATGDFGTHWHQEAHAAAGLSYHRGTVSKVFDPPSPTISYRPPTFSGEVEATASLTPEISVKAYGLAGPKASLPASLIASANLQAGSRAGSLDWSLKGRIRGYASIDAGPLGWESERLLVLEPPDYQIASGSIAWEPPPGYGPEITTSALPDGTPGTFYQQRLATADNRHGRWAVTDGTLPAGLNLDPDTGTISGLPTLASTSTFTVSFTDGFGNTATKRLTLRVAEPQYLRTPDALMVQAGAGTTPSYWTTLEAGFSGTGTWTVDPNSLPRGLSLAADGTLSGVPTENGVFMFDAVRTREDGSSTVVHLLVPVIGLYIEAACDPRTRRTRIQAALTLRNDAGDLMLVSFEPHRVTTRLDGQIHFDQTVPPRGLQDPAGSVWPDLPSGVTYDVALTVDGVTARRSVYCAP
jgi:hypothetical protein